MTNPTDDEGEATINEEAAEIDARSPEAGEEIAELVEDAGVSGTDLPADFAVDQVED